MAATGTPTPNLGLRIPVGTDPASVDDINYNSNVLDTKIGAVGSTSVQDQINNNAAFVNGRIGTSDGITWLKAWDANGEYRLQLNNPNALYLLEKATGASSWTQKMNIADSLSSVVGKTKTLFHNENVNSFSFTVGSTWFVALFISMISTVGLVLGFIYNNGTSPTFVRLDGNITGFKDTDSFSISQSGTTVTITALNSKIFREATVIIA